MPNSTRQPVTHGRGSGDICADAQHYTVMALREIDRLMRESKDEKLRFTCARYLLEQGWGRPALRKLAAETPEENIDPALKERIYVMIESLRTEKLLLAHQPKK